MAIELDYACSNCTHYDGDHYCALPKVKRKLAGWIDQPEDVVCAAHEPAQTELQALDQAAKDDENRPTGWKDRR